MKKFIYKLKNKFNRKQNLKSRGKRFAMPFYSAGMNLVSGIDRNMKFFKSKLGLGLVVFVVVGVLFFQTYLAKAGDDFVNIKVFATLDGIIWTGTVYYNLSGVIYGSYVTEDFPYVLNSDYKVYYISGGPFTSNVGFSSVTKRILNFSGPDTVEFIMNFVSPSYTLSVTKAGTGKGTVTASIGCTLMPFGDNSCSQTVNSGIIMPLSAVPYINTSRTKTGETNWSSSFMGWSGDADCLDGSVIMNADKTCTATFELNPLLTVTFAGTGNGQVVTLPQYEIECGGGFTYCLKRYTPGTAVTLTATPSAGSTFAGWSGNADCSDGNVTMGAVNTAKTCTATFNLIPPPSTYTLSVTKSGTGIGTVTSAPAGIDCGSDCWESYNSGTSVTLTATPLDISSTFIGWSGACTGTGSCVVSMTEFKSVTAIFNVATASVTITKSGTGKGIVNFGYPPPPPLPYSCPVQENTCDPISMPNNFVRGTIIELESIPEEGSGFSGWSNCSSDSGPLIQIILNTDKTCNATFNFNLIPPPGIPSFVLDPSSASINIGQTQQFNGWYDADGPGGPSPNTFVAGASIGSWNSSNNGIATVNGSGLATGISAGSVTISGTYNSTTATASLTVGATSVGNINVKATLDGAAWSGGVNYSLSGPVSLSGSSVPTTFTDKPSGIYTISYTSGGPGGTPTITPASSQFLPGGSAIEFTLNFKSICNDGIDNDGDGQTDYPNDKGCEGLTDNSETISVSCSVSPTSAVYNQSVTWTASPSGGQGPYTYLWSGNVSGTTQTVTTSYNSSGIKTGSVKITSGTDTATSPCSNSVSVTTAANQSPISSALISKDGLNYTESITVTQGSPLNIYLSASGSSDPDGWTLANGVSSGGKCEWNIDLAVPFAVQSTVTSPASPSSCNKGPLAKTFNDVPGTYTYAVSAYDAAGNESGKSSSVITTTLSPKPYEKINIIGENASKGVFDPSLEHDDKGVIWMVYTAIEMEEKGNAHSTDLAKSEDGGKTWQYVARINSSPMGEVTLEGKKIFGNWRNEVATLVDDKDDPDPSKRWKLFWHKYFMKAPFGENDRVLPYFGWIAYKYAASPSALAQAEEIRLFGNYPFPFNPDDGKTPYPVKYYLNQIDQNLNGFLAFTEPGVLAKDGRLYLSIESIPAVFEERRIFLISSKDHGNTWQYQGVLLDKNDAKNLNTPILTASSLFEENNRTFIMVSPVTPKGMNGILVFEFKNIASAKLKRDGSGNLILVKRVEPFIEGEFSGAGDYDAKKTYGGIIISQVDILKVIETKSKEGSMQIFDTKEKIDSATDTTAPSIPTNLTVTTVSSSQINLSWTASTDNVGVTGYKIYRCAGSACAPTAQIATSPTNSYSNTGLTASTAYTYQVLRITDNKGAVSNIDTVTVVVKTQCQNGIDDDLDGKIDFGGANPDLGCSSETDNDETDVVVPPPSAPTPPPGGGPSTSPVCVASNNSDIVLNWTDNSNNKDGFKIYRGVTSTFTPTDPPLITTPPNTTTATDASPVTGVAYYYKIAAYNSAGNSPYLTLGPVTADSCAPTFVIIDSSGDANATIQINDNEQYDGKYDSDGPGGSAPETTIARALITWVSSNISVATINGKGKAKGEAFGSTKIQGTYSAITAEANITIAACSNDCSPSGAAACQGNSVITCGNYDADFCLEWSSPPTPCGAGETCVSGSCVAAPAITFTASPSTIKQGESTVLSWNATNVDSCVASGGWEGDWSGSKPISSASVPISDRTVSPKRTSSYTLTCVNTSTGTPVSETRQIVVKVVVDIRPK